MSLRALTALAAAFVFALPLTAQTASAVPDPASAPSVEHYKLHIVLDVKEHTLAGKADITIKNSAAQPLTSVPILLYRLMDLSNVASADGKPLPFVQKVVKFPDEPKWQVNGATVTIPPVAPGSSTTIHLEYAGPLFGYPEVMQYVRDTIGEEYSLLRAESMPYPMVGVPGYAGWRGAKHNKYDYVVETIVPAGYVAVCSGNSQGAGEAVAGGLLFRCSDDSEDPDINIAVAKFQVYDDAQRHLRVYAMPADADAGKRILTEMIRALDFYAAYYGPRKCFRYGGGPCNASVGNGLQLVEIPSGWGSYATGGTIFQAGAAFKDPQRAGELYHEVGHLWNARPVDSIQRSRYFDEAFASYDEALAVGHFSGEEAFRKEMEDARKYYTQGVAKEPRGRTTAIADYGKFEIGGFSYSKGAWSLHVLHQLLGDDLFRLAMGKFLDEYSSKPVTFENFLRSLQQSTGRDLKPWYEKWITSGEPSSTWLLEGKTVEEMAAQCQASAPASSK